MAKLIPFSLVIMTIALPIFLARRPRPARSMRILWGSMAAFILVWAYLCMYVYTQYVFVE